MGKRKSFMQIPFTWWTFRIFFIFSARGGGRGSPRCQEGGGSVFIKKSNEGGGGLQDGRGREGVCSELGTFGGGGGGGKIFFWGPKCPPSFNSRNHSGTPGVAPRIAVFRIAQVVRRNVESGISHSENFF